MPRYKLTIEYDGSPFVGWQSQTNGLSVQQVLEEGIKGFCGKDVKVNGAGRTDAGVHALGQVAHIDLETAVACDTLRDAVNAHMRPHPVSILGAEEVPEAFEARFSAIRRHYMYRIVNRRAPLTLDRGQAWLVHKPLDADAMHAAAQTLVGRHDFTTFRSVQCQAKSPVKTVDEISVALCRRNRGHLPGAKFPAQPGALLRRYTETGGRRQVDAARRWEGARREGSRRLRPGCAARRALSLAGRLRVSVSPA